MLLYEKIEDLETHLYGTARTTNRLLRIFVTMATDETHSAGVSDALRQVFLEEKENLLANRRRQLAKLESLDAPQFIIQKTREDVEKLSRQCERCRNRSSADFLRLVDRITQIYSARMNYRLLLDLGPTPEFPDFGESSEDRRAHFLKW